MSLSARGNLKMALASIRSTKWRSFLTVLGVIIGVGSVVTVMGIGQGVKRQISDQIDHFGQDLIVVRPGKLAATTNPKRVTRTDILLDRSQAALLTTDDAAAVSTADQVAASAPLGTVSSAATADGRTVADEFIIATSDQLPQVIGQSVRYGSFFGPDAAATDVVIGQKVAHELFDESVPLGRTFVMRGQSFMVRGIFAEFNSSPMSPTAGFDNAIFMPYQTASQLTHNGVQFYAILAKPTSSKSQKAAISSITNRLVDAHGGEKDFSVLNRGQAEAAATASISSLTAFITAVAVISLLVGGIGIMNVMLVSVTERMHEIGVRKAVGATNRQILAQFTLEAVVLSTTGGVIGVVLSVIVEMLLRTYTTYKPVILIQPMIAAIIIAVIVGVVFGVAPAFKAARKDPIEALRHE